MTAQVKAHTNIQGRLIALAERSGLTPAEISRAIDASDLYGYFSHTQYRMLITYPFDDHEKPRVQFNRQLLIAFSEVFGCALSDLATESDLAQIRDVPYRRNQWPQFMRDEQFAEKLNTRTTVTAPKTTAQRIVAYSKQHAYNNASELAARMREFGYPITNRDMRILWEKEPKPEKLRTLVTFKLCVAVARVFRGALGRNHFDVQWLLQCTDTCPHCRPDLYLYN